MPGMTELIVVLVIVVLLFGTKKLKTLGGDLGSAIKGFRSALGGVMTNQSLTPTRNLNSKMLPRTLQHKTKSKQIKRISLYVRHRFP